MVAEASSSAPGRAPRASRWRGRRGSPRPSCRSRRSSAPGCSTRRRGARGRSCRASRRCRCAGGRGSRTRRARRPPRCARTFALHRRGDRAAERGLAHAGRADEQDDRAARLGVQLAHGEELEDAVLHALDVVVVARRAPRARASGRGCPRSTSTTAATRATPGSCGSRRARRTAAAAARSATARARPASRRARAGPPPRAACAAPRPPPPARPPRRAPPGSRGAAGAGSTRAGPCPSRTGTCVWMRLPISTSSSSRARISDSRRSRLVTSRSSSSSCFSSVLMRSAPAIAWASSAGSSMFATAIWSSSGRYGSSSMMREKVDCTLRWSPSSSGEGTSSSGASAMRATRYGSVATKSPSSTRCPHWTRIRTRAVRHLDHPRDHAGHAHAGRAGRGRAPRPPGPSRRP